MAAQDTADQPAHPVPSQSAPAGATAYSEGYIRWALTILLVIYTLNFLDRQIVTILAEDIRRDLDLADWQIGVMTGLAFAFFYTVLGIPIARMADRGDRVTILTVSLAVWSGFTALCGLAQNFTQMLLARIGVGIGEAGCTPAAHSLIADYVPQERRARALAFYGLGLPLGGLLGLVLGGLIADAFGWRAAFFVAGVPGVLLAIYAWFALKEPRRTLGFAKGPADTEAGFGAVLGVLLKSRAFVMVALASASAAFIGYGVGAFMPAFFIRVHGLSAGETGLWLGLSSGISGLIGTWLGGVLADRFGAKDPGLFLIIPGVGFGIASLTFTPGLLAGNWMAALALIFIPGLLNSLWYGPAFATVQRLVAPQSRAMAVAIILFVINMVGLGFGPLALGALSDTIREIQFERLAPELGVFKDVCSAAAGAVVAPECAVARAEGLRWSLIACIHLGLITATLFWLAGRATRKAEAEKAGAALAA